MASIYARRSGSYAHTLLWILALVLALTTQANAAKPTAQQVLYKALKPYSGVKDYTVNAKFTAKSPSIHVPEMSVKVYFKSPDKVHIESRNDSFAVLPRQEILFGNPVRELIRGELSLGKSALLMGRACYVVKSSFLRSERLVDATVWVDKKDYLIRQIIYTGELSAINPEQSKLTLQLSYIRVDNKYWLPETSRAEISSQVVPTMDPRDLLDQKRGQPMTVIAKFSDYKVNVGLKDSIFREDED